ncbi:hypothetical protein [Pseudonocardia acidicola]|uniref:Ferritin-like metal-binding protein YciE n=1 Tax=Pseudonocardia acidicola TaxID=2724939 RepID=A0ABX1SLE6_9PSEU|nr:hypothetical protein [Pseudonocardia acidicola]NMI01237.1 hypothetical protein [Pseudonocardia acidicola]
MSARQLLGIYLNDHLDGANAGAELARRLEAEAAGAPDADVLSRMAGEIEEDREVLRKLVDRIGSGPDPAQQMAGWAAEKAHRLAVDEKLTVGADLTLLRESETLSLGVEGKLDLLLVLLEVAPAHPELADVDLGALADRAREQRSRLEAFRRNAARRAFAGHR